MTDYTARPENWGHITRHDFTNPYADCLMELRARVERLEQAQQQPEPEPAAAPAEPADRLDTTLGELLRMHRLYRQGKPDGRRLDLSGLDLNGVYLPRADLRNADLRGASLINADLRDVNLRNTDLSGANMNGSIGLPVPAPAEQLPEPAPSTPAGQGELVRSVREAITNATLDCRSVAPAAILAVADWWAAQGSPIAAEALRREVRR
jgi:hypothetical protein